CALVEKGLRTQARCELAAAIRSARRWLPMRHEACLEDFTLCHALGGSCALLMEVAHVTGCLAAKNAASRLMTPALSRTGEEQAASIVASLGPGLFKGAAGVAWVLLQVSESTCVCPLRLDARSDARVVARRSS